MPHAPTQPGAQRLIRFGFLWGASNSIDALRIVFDDLRRNVARDRLTSHALLPDVGNAVRHERRLAIANFARIVLVGPH